MTTKEIRFHGPDAPTDAQSGLTVEQSWYMASALYGMRPMCLLSSHQPATPIERISAKAMLAPADLLAFVWRAFELVPVQMMNALIFDGQMGHAINPTGINKVTDSFLFLDPWPGRSLLCKENNAAGVAAQVWLETLWRIPRQELERVVFAVFLTPNVWALLNGLESHTFYHKLLETDFFSFFNLREVNREVNRDIALGDLTLIKLKPSEFQESIDIEIQVDSQGVVHRATLRLDRAWMGQYGINPFANEISKSFITAIITEADRQEAAPLTAEIWDLNDRENTILNFLRNFVNSSPLNPQVRSILATYIGLRESSRLDLALSTITATNSDEHGKTQLSLDITMTTVRYAANLRASGNDYARQGRYEEALAAYREQLEARPDNARIYRGLGEAHAALDQTNEALAAYQHALTLNSDDIETLLGLGAIYMKYNIYDQALAAFQQAHKLAAFQQAHKFGKQRHWRRVYQGFSSVYLKLGRYNEAVVAHQMAHQLASKLDSILTPSLAAQEGPTEALAAYQAVLANDPNNVVALCGVGDTYAEQGQIETALAVYHHTLMLDSSDPLPHRSMGRMYVQYERFAEALSAYQAALKLDPNDAASHYGLGVVYTALGRSQEGLDSYHRAYPFLQ